jgi:glutamate synthase (NADPH/NADH) small chain
MAEKKKKTAKKKTKAKKKIIPKKIPMPEQDAVERGKNFNEVALGYSAELGMREAERCLDCKKNIPQFIKAIKKGDFKSSIEIIKDKNLLPAVCGRVCPQESQCEQVCILGKKNDPVAIGRLERLAADLDIEQGLSQTPKVGPSTGKKVAIVGSGPAGLTCAFDLAKLGHKVTIYEALHEPGGVLLYGIPEFRLPKGIVAHEIATLKDMGIDIVPNAVIGKLITVDELMEDYDACFIGTGAGLPRFMGIEGETLNGVYSANEFLTRANLMKAYKFPENDTPIAIGKRVAVVGGGNVAMDSVRTALRLGAKEAIIVYRRSEVEMPARLEEVHHAKEEGIRFEILTNPIKIHGKNGWVSALECIRMDLSEPDESGRRRPVPIEGSEFTMPVDIVIMAVGTNANPLVPKSTSRLELNKWGYIEADEDTGRTTREGVFAGGDIVTGSATVISAMGAGKKAAEAINRFLLGEPEPEPEKQETKTSA